MSDQVPPAPKPPARPTAAAGGAAKAEHKPAATAPAGPTDPPPPADKAVPPVQPVPESQGLEVATSVRAIKTAEELPGLPPGTRAVSVFLVNRRAPIEGQELRHPQNQR